MKTTSKSAPSWITTAKAARLLHVSPSTMLRACEAGKYRCFKTPGGHYRVDPKGLELSVEAVENVSWRLRAEELERAVRWAIAEPGGLNRWQREELATRAGLC